LKSTLNIDNWTFGSTDYWTWGEGLGKCGNYSGYIGTDAADKIANYANMDVSVPTGGDYVYPTSILQVDAFYCDYPDYFWSASGTGDPPVDPPCLSPTTMNYYLAKIKNLGNVLKPTNKTIIGYYLSEDYLTSSDGWCLCHAGQITYGNWHISNPGD